MFYIMLGNTIVARFYNMARAQDYIQAISPQELAVWNYRIEAIQ
jgi:hypothetical protein